MKLLTKLWNWFRDLLESFRRKKSSEKVSPQDDQDDQVERFRFVFIDDTLETYDRNCIYILNEGYIDEALYLVCPCGCKAIIELNLLVDSKPLWKYSIIGGRINISPSIWRTVGCRSHFFIRNGNIQWALD